MTQRDKLYQKFTQNPSSVSYKELQKILSWYEFEKIEAKGSHVKYKHPLFERDLIVAVHKNECKSYIKKEAHRRLKIINS
jgi:predicted RNA binding protein YcfA (HicA-like mRNA interferase family)